MWKLKWIFFCVAIFPAKTFGDLRMQFFFISVTRCLTSFLLRCIALGFMRSWKEISGNFIFSRNLKLSHFQTKTFPFLIFTKFNPSRNEFGVECAINNVNVLFGSESRERAIKNHSDVTFHSKVKNEKIYWVINFVPQMDEND